MFGSRPITGPACLAAGFLAAGHVWSQALPWSPTKNVEIIAPAGPGGSIDIAARTLQRVLQDKKLLPVPSIVVNKPGGGNTVGTNYLVQNARDPHYVAMLSNTILSNRITGRTTLSYRDVTPLSLLFSEYVVFAVRSDSVIKDGKELIDHLRKDPQSLSLALPVLGGAFHIAISSALKAGGGDIKKLKLVVFNSVADSITALLGGHIDVIASAPSSVLPQMPSRKLRILAISSPQRLTGGFAQVPTWREQGVDSVLGTFRFLAAPKELTREQVTYWERTLADLTKANEWTRATENRFWVTDYRNSRDTEKFLEAQNKELTSIFIELGLAK